MSRRVGFDACSFGGTQFFLDEGERREWFADPVIVLSAIAGVVGYSGFVLWELFGARTPIVKLSVFRNRSVAFGSAIGIALGVPLFGTALIIPQYVSGLLSFTATLSGYLVLVRALPIALLTPVVGLLVQSGKIDPRLLLGFGVVITGGGTVWEAFTTTSGSDFSTFVFPLVMQGVGSAMLFVPLLITVLGSVNDPEDRSSVSAFINLFFQLGGSIAAAVLVTVLGRRQVAHYSVLVSDLRLDRPAVHRVLELAGPGGQDSATGGLVRLVQQQSATLAYADTFLIIGALTLIVVPLIFGLPKPLTTNVALEAA